MAVKASVTITISKYRDTDSITRYYKLQASTAAAPAVPTTLTPSGWSTSEPTYTSGSTNTLYYTDCIVFSDGTFQYTDDGNGKAVKSSSYEAAKEAYNKAQAAQSTANATQENLDNLKIGNKNYLSNSGNFNTLDGWVKNGSNGADKNILELINIDGIKAIHGKGSIAKAIDIKNNPILKYNTVYCLHMYIKFTIDFVGGSSTPMHYHFQSLSSPEANMYSSGYKNYSITPVYYYVDEPGNVNVIANKWVHIVKIFKTPKHEDDNDYLRIRPFIYGENYGVKSDYYLAWIKLEEGNKPTDWTPAPEDIDNAIAKTVKQVDVEYYLSTSSSSVTGGSWSTTAPTWVNGKYMWSRQKVTYVDGTTTTRNETCIAGAKGETGSTGTGIESITEEYYLSTSKESQTGGSWSTTPPTWESGKYIWTRSKIVYKNPASIAYTTPLCSSEWEAVNELEIGGRNYILRSSEEYTLSIPQGTNKYAFRALNISDALIELDETIKTFTISFDAYSQNGGTHLQGYLRGTTASPMDSAPDSGISTTEWKRYSITKTIKNGYTVKNIVNFYLRIEGDSTDTVYFKNIKVEVGNKPTDWTPAPEDIDENIETVSAYAQNVANELLTTKGQLTAATTRIDSLQGIIENFVKDDNGMVTVTQTGSGMQIDMTQATNRINQLLTAIESAVTELEADQLRTELLAAIQAVQSRTAYINATQDAQGRPVITLGATDSPFKVEITNEAINFIQNGQVIAYANGQKFYNLRTVVQQDVQIGIGPGFIWKTRDSGNMGLTWVPAQS